MNAQNTARVAALVASVLNLPNDAVGPDATMENIGLWDSLAQLNICLAFQEQCGVDLDMETIATATSVAKLAELLPN